MNISLHINGGKQPALQLSGDSTAERAILNLLLENPGRRWFTHVVKSDPYGKPEAIKFSVDPASLEQKA